MHATRLMPTSGECGSNSLRCSLKDEELIDHSELHIASSLITNLTCSVQYRRTASDVLRSYIYDKMLLHVNEIL